MAVTNTDIQITEQVLLDAARKYDKTLRTLPMLAMQDTLKYVTVVPNIQGDLVMTQLRANAHWATYRNNDSNESHVNLDPRILHTDLLSLELSFDPNQVAAKLWDQRPNVGDGLANVPIAAKVLMEVLRESGENMNAQLFKAKRQTSGKLESTSFNGWDTIVENEITAGNIAENKGNYKDLSAYQITQDNAFDAINYIYALCDEKLKGYGQPNRPLFIYCSPDVQNYYNIGYHAALGSVVYNKQWNQPTVLGSNGNCILVPIISKAGSNYIQVSTKSNMLFGTDRMNDMNDLKVKVPKLWDVLAGGTMWAGTQFEFIDKEALFVAKIGGVAGPTNPFLASNASSQSGGSSQSGDSSQSGGSSQADQGS